MAYTPNNPKPTGAAITATGNVRATNDVALIPNKPPDTPAPANPNPPAFPQFQRLLDCSLSLQHLLHNRYMYVTIPSRAFKVSKGSLKSFQFIKFNIN